MVTFWNQHHIAIGWCHCFIQFPILSKYPLETKSLRRVKAVVIGLFQISRVRKIVFIVAMGWVRRAIALWCEHLSYQQTIGNITVFHGDIVNVAGVGTLAAFRQLNTNRTDDFSFVSAFSRRGTYSKG